MESNAKAINDYMIKKYNEEYPNNTMERKSLLMHKNNLINTNKTRAPGYKKKTITSTLSPEEMAAMKEEAKHNLLETDQMEIPPRIKETIVICKETQTYETIKIPPRAHSIMVKNQYTQTSEHQQGDKIIYPTRKKMTDTVCGNTTQEVSRTEIPPQSETITPEPQKEELEFTMEVNETVEVENCEEPENEPPEEGLNRTADETTIGTEDGNTWTSPEEEEFYHELINAIEEDRQTQIKDRNHLRKIKTNENTKKAIQTANEVLTKLLTNETSLTTINRTIYCSAKIITQKEYPNLGEVREAKNKNKTPKWQCRLENKQATLRKEISLLQEHHKGNLGCKKLAKIRTIVKKEKLHNATKIEEALGRRKMALQATSKKLRRYKQTAEEKKQNREFEENPTKFFRRLKDGEITVTNPPTETAIDEFWRNQFETETSHNQNARWLNDIKTDNITEMAFIPLSTAEVLNTIRKTDNWKSPGPDKTTNFWFKKLTNCHQSLTCALNRILEGTEEIPQWLTEGTTNLLPKSEETHLPNKYRPITCLPTIYKYLTGIISNRIEAHLNTNNIMTEEQKGCTNKTYGTKDQLLINKTILENAKNNQRNLAMAWIDYKKAYDSVPHSWIHDILKIYKINPTIRAFMQRVIPAWKIYLQHQHKSGTIKLPPIQIKGGIFKGDALSPLLFVMALNPLSTMLKDQNLGYQMEARNKNSPKVSHLLYMDDLKLYAPDEIKLTKQLELVSEFTHDIRMDFGLDKCAKINLRKGKSVTTPGIQVDEYNIQNLEQEGTYKYLGIEENSSIKQKEMKIKIKNEYFRRLKKIMKTELNNKNRMSAINALALPVITYSFGIIDWFQHEINEIDVKTRKKLHAYKCIHKNMCLPRLYLPRREAGLGLIEVDQAHRTTIVGLKTYLEENHNEMLKITREHDNRKPPRTSIIKKAIDYKKAVKLPEHEIPPEGQADKPPTEKAKHAKIKYKKAREKDRIEKWEDHNYSKAYKKDVLNRTYLDKESSTNWLKYGSLRKENESIIIAAQDKGLKTNWFMKWIAKKNISDQCRLCNDGIETPNHILSGCTVLLKNGTYTNRHDLICKYIHGKLCQHYSIVLDNQEDSNGPPPIIDKDHVRITYDQEIITDVRLPHNRPDITITDKATKKPTIIEVGISNDFRIVDYENEKKTKYARLCNEMRRLTGFPTCVVPVIIGSTGAVKISLRDNISKTPCKLNIDHMVKTTLNASAAILKQFLAI